MKSCSIWTFIRPTPPCTTTRCLESLASLALHDRPRIPWSIHLSLTADTLGKASVLWGPGTKISPGGATVIRNRKFAPYWRSPLRQLLRICFVQMNISHGPFPNCERSWEEGMCACREEKKTSSPGKMHVLRTHFSTSRHTTLRHFHCIKINAEDSLLRFHKVKPVGLSKLPVPLTVAPPGESAIVPGPHCLHIMWHTASIVNGLRALQTSST